MIADAIANALLIVVVFAACLHIVYAVLRLAIVALGATRTDPALRRIMRDRRGRGAAGGAVPPFLRAYRYRCDCPEGGGSSQRGRYRALRP